MKFVKRLKDESGQAMIVSLLSMTVLLGVVGFAADVGTLLRAKRNLQIAADSAAIAGAAEINFADMTSAGQAAAAQNGVVIGTSGGAVTINTPPTEGAYAGQGGYVEAIVSQTQPTFFMKVFKIASQTVTARAVATTSVSTGCVYVLSPNGSPALELQGSSTLTAPNCGVIVDSNDPDALHFTGAKASLTAGSVGVVGGVGGQTGDSTPPAITGIAPVSDPLGSMTPPTPTGCTTPAGTMTGTLSPGCYSAAAGKKGALGTITLNNATLNSGTYIFEGNVVLEGTVSTIASGGTTLDIVNGALTENTGTVLDLVAPSPCSSGLPPCSGSYGGIAILQPSSNSNSLTFDKGSSSGLIDGIIYAPNAQLFLQDSGGDKNGGLQLITDLIVGTIDNKTAQLTITNYSSTVSNSPLTKVALVE